MGLVADARNYRERALLDAVHQVERTLQTEGCYDWHAGQIAWEMPLSPGRVGGADRHQNLGLRG